MNQRQRILVVDGDRDMLAILNRTLEVAGFDTVHTGAGGSARALLDSGPDLVILDTTIPGIEVFDILDHLRQLSDVPIVILSHEYALETLSVALSRGADDFIRKPFGTRSFVARLRAKLRRAQKQVV
jgi:two-component system, OmpR family, KDP operon response regulator KdpE